MVQSVSAAGDLLGESPVWDSLQRCLWWIDIHGRKLHRFDPAAGVRTDHDLPEQVGCIALYDGTKLLAGTRCGFSLLDPGGRMVSIVDVLGGRPDIRFNDGRCDRCGRFWAGTVQERRIVGEAAIYRLGIDRRATRILSGLTVSNGIAWSPDNATMYFADTNTREIFACDFAAETGEVANRRLFARYPEEFGVPDGATVDVEGHLWSAGFGGWHLLRFTPDGRLDDAVRLPVSQPTSCTFGGPDLSTLFITSATMRLTEEQLSEQPMAGSLLTLNTEVRGLDEPRYTVPTHDIA